MTEIVLKQIVLIAVVNVEHAAIHARRVGEIAFVIFHAAISATPLPDRIWRSNGLCLLHSCVPCHVVFQHAVGDPGEQNAIAGHVMDHGIPDLNVLAVIAHAARVKACPADNDARPF